MTDRNCEHAGLLERTGERNGSIARAGDERNDLRGRAACVEAEVRKPRTKTTRPLLELCAEIVRGVDDVERRVDGRDHGSGRPCREHEAAARVDEIAHPQR